jgi:hypothetical protein
MRTNRFLILGMGLMCLLGTVQAFGQAANRSYYVRADGNDANNGRSEEAPFKTLKKAIEMAVAGAVKTITVIGTVEGCKIGNAGSSEILITGKPDASETEKALISSSVSINNSKVTFTHVQITSTRGRGLDLTSAIVTLGVGARITNGVGVRMESTTLNMTDNAVITGNSTSLDGGGVAGDGRVIINMTDNAAISGNSAGRYGGGAFGHDLIKGGRVMGNTAKQSGGVWGVEKMENVDVSGNKADEGAGVYNRGVLLTVTGGKITGNTAKERGGGVFAEVCKMENVEISGNKAEYGAGYYLEKGKLTIAGGKITANEAEFVGGGVYAKTGATYEPGKDASVTGNKAGDGEGEDVFKQ